MSTAPIDWPSHVSWFVAKLSDPRCLIFIAHDAAGDAVGQIRFDVIGDSRAEVDISISDGRRGEGLGLALVREGVEALHAVRRDITVVRALLRSTNVASKKSFEFSGFSRVGSPRIDGAEFYIYELHIGRP
jgi:hypothetical protein